MVCQKWSWESGGDQGEESDWWTEEDHPLVPLRSNRSADSVLGRRLVFAKSCISISLSLSVLRNDMLLQSWPSQSDMDEVPRC